MTYQSQLWRDGINSKFLQIIWTLGCFEVANYQLEIVQTFLSKPVSKGHRTFSAFPWVPNNQKAPGLHLAWSHFCAVLRGPCQATRVRNAQKTRGGEGQGSRSPRGPRFLLVGPQLWTDRGFSLAHSTQPAMKRWPTTRAMGTSPVKR